MRDLNAECRKVEKLCPFSHHKDFSDWVGSWEALVSMKVWWCGVARCLNEQVELTYKNLFNDDERILLDLFIESWETRCNLKGEKISPTFKMLSVLDLWDSWRVCHLNVILSCGFIVQLSLMMWDDVFAADLEKNLRNSRLNDWSRQVSKVPATQSSSDFVSTSVIDYIDSKTSWQIMKL